MNINEGYKQYLATENAVLVDVREDYEYAQGSIKEAVNVPLSRIETINIVANPDQTLFVFCRSGMRAQKAVEKLHELGYHKLYEIGGITDFKGTIQ